MNLIEELLKEKSKPKLTILDVDSVLYLVGHHLRDQMNFAGQVAFKEQAKQRIYGFLDRCKADYYLGFYSSSGKLNFRHHFATIKPYKGNRTGKKEDYVSYFEPGFYKLLKDEFGFHDMVYIEADDALMIAGKMYENEYDITFVNMDKDHRQFGKLTQFNPRKYEFESFTYESGRKHFWCQNIHGDSTDNIAGIQGQGKKSPYVKAIEALNPYSEEAAYEIVRDAYIAKYGNRAEMVMAENHILLRMLDKPMFDYDPEKIVPVPYLKAKEDIVNILDI